MGFDLKHVCFDGDPSLQLQVVETIGQALGQSIPQTYSMPPNLQWYGGVLQPKPQEGYSGHLH